MKKNVLLMNEVKKKKKKKPHIKNPPSDEKAKKYKTKKVYSDSKSKQDNRIKKTRRRKVRKASEYDPIKQRQYRELNKFKKQIAYGKKKKQYAKKKRQRIYEPKKKDKRSRLSKWAEKELKRSKQGITIPKSKANKEWFVPEWEGLEDSYDPIPVVNGNFLEVINDIQDLINEHMSHLRENNIKPDARNNIVKFMNDYFTSTKITIKKQPDNYMFLDCIKNRLYDLLDFLYKLSQYNYSIGKFIKYSGFHPPFLVEDDILDSSKIVENVLKKFQAHISSCNKYL